MAEALEEMSTEELQAAREDLTAQRAEAEAGFVEKLEPIVAEISRRAPADALAAAFTEEQLQAALAVKRATVDVPTIGDEG